MARINIEDSIYQDIRFIDLIQKSGSVEMALGIMVRVWTVAQKYWKQGKHPIPKQAWLERRLSWLVVECGLATENDDGSVYVKGSEEQFRWMISQSENGRKGGLKSKGKKVSDAKRRLSPAKPTQASSSSSSSFSPSFSLSDSTPPGGEEPASPDDVQTGPTWNSYTDAYFKKYGCNPTRNSKVNSQMKQFVKNAGQANAPFVAEYYLTLNEYYYATKMHPVGLLVSDCEKLCTQWKTGMKVSQADLQQRDKATAAEMQRERIMRGEL